MHLKGRVLLSSEGCCAKNPSEPWYNSCPVGKNTLATMLKRMCVEAGITEPKTNPSLRATGTTRLFQGNVPEKFIQKITGHSSLEALRTYERVSTEQLQAASRVLTSSKEAPTFSAEIQHIREFNDPSIWWSFQCVFSSYPV